jgi:hypothetical protein
MKVNRQMGSKEQDTRTFKSYKMIKMFGSKKKKGKNEIHGPATH